MMSAPTTDDIQQVLQRVRTWPAPDRLALIQTLVASLRTELTAAEPRKESLLDLRGIAAGQGPPPDDETVKRWIDEHRMEKYGR